MMSLFVLMEEIKTVVSRVQCGRGISRAGQSGGEEWRVGRSHVEMTLTFAKLISAFTFSLLTEHKDSHSKVREQCKG